MSSYHRSVLLQEVLENLQVVPGEKYIDTTLGGGGHSFAIAKAGGIVLGIDQDDDALHYVLQEMPKEQVSVKLAKGNFSLLRQIAQSNGFASVSGILFDLGVSSHQLDVGERGFSFQKDAPLDMRMDTQTAVRAKDLVNGLHKGELAELLQKFGEEPFAKKIADHIVEARKGKPITTTRELADIVRKCYGGGKGKVHPATKVFQALRIAVNDELQSITQALPQALGLLKPTGRIAVIAFHSLEDRIIKQTFLSFEEKGWGKIITKKPIEPSEEEIAANPRSRSSKLRVFEKI